MPPPFPAHVIIIQIISCPKHDLVHASEEKLIFGQTALERRRDPALGGYTFCCNRVENCNGDRRRPSAVTTLPPDKTKEACLPVQADLYPDRIEMCFDIMKKARDNEDTPLATAKACEKSGMCVYVAREPQCYCWGCTSWECRGPPEPNRWDPS
jgi:hypothetical protein